MNICNLTPEVIDILNILWKRGEITTKEQLLLFSTMFCDLFLDLQVKTGTRISLRDKRLFEISKVEITRGNCIFNSKFTILLQFVDLTCFSYLCRMPYPVT